MGRLTRIYTRGGDSGETSLGDGTRVPKDHPRLAAYGTIDELNSVLGLLLSYARGALDTELVLSIQNDLLDLGADLAVPEKTPGKKKLSVGKKHVEKLEAAIDRINSGLAPLGNFILPGGTPASAWCHLARTICRRAERLVVALSRTEEVNSLVVLYLNRLSDLLFVMARDFNNKGRDDVLWGAGGGQKGE